MNRMTQDDVRGAALEWAIKDSLVSYVRAMKDGKVAVQLPAEEFAGGFRFPAEPEISHDGSLRFTGCVRLSGHSGMLRLQFEDPWLVPGGSPSDPWTLTIIDPYEPGERMVFARIAQVSAGAGIALTASGTTLTEDGADLFLSGPYEPGTEFDNPRVVALG